MDAEDWQLARQGRTASDKLADCGESEQEFEAALRLHRAGHFAEAAAIYERIVAANPDDPDALHLLGLCELHLGQRERAIALLQRAVSAEANVSEFHKDLGNALALAARNEEARAALDNALALEPGNAEALVLLGRIHRVQRRTDAAVACFRRAVASQPEWGVARAHLGGTLADQGRISDAIPELRRAVEIDPVDFDSLNSLGNLLLASGHTAEATEIFRRVVQSRPENGAAFGNLGLCLALLGDIAGALECNRKAIALCPLEPAILNNLATLLAAHGSPNDSIDFYERLIALDPLHSSGRGNFAQILQRCGRYDEAYAQFERSVELNPNDIATRVNFAAIQSAEGALDDAIETLRHAIFLDPLDSRCHSSLLFNLHYQAGCTRADIFSEHLKWEKRHAEPLSRFAKAHPNNPNPARTLRIGFVSADFRAHPVAVFFDSCLTAKSSALEIFCYSCVVVPDLVTQRLMALADGWRNIAGIPDEGVANLIRGDQIDILVDLSGHTAGSRLTVFAHKPAPVQVTWLGYPDTTGLRAIDYRFTDTHVVPPGEADEYHSEKVIRLPETFACYRASDEAPEVRELPALQNGFVTFGCLNNTAKINADILSAWAAILAATPRSKLLLPPAGGRFSRFVQAQMGMHQVDETRVLFARHPSCLRESLDTHNEFDIGLDPFPYNGHTSTVNALFMGVPIVSLAGEISASRVGLSILENMRLRELAARSREEYVEIATRLASDIPLLQTLRGNLRQRLADSPLTDSKRFMRNFETCLRQTWIRWCESNATRKYDSPPC